MAEQVRSYGEDPNKLKHQYLITVRNDFQNAVGQYARANHLSIASVYRMGAKRLLKEAGYTIRDEW